MQEEAELIRDFAKGDDEFLSLSRSTVIGAPEETARALCAARRRVRNGSILLSDAIFNGDASHENLKCWDDCKIGATRSVCKLMLGCGRFMTQEPSDPQRLLITISVSGVSRVRGG